ncbi:MAG: type II toxin-antitoxin system HicB family antitoxin [Ruminococcus sp.]|jgi:predicted RNase H-like HicB family nuclease|nr:type II toxin-antitoxin system HicB family antitoxin [Ruminococcus sp.]
MVYTYPACFYTADDGITVDFPDLPGCVTCGMTMDEAILMAEDAACGWIHSALEDDEPIPSPSDYKNVTATEYDNGFVNLIRLDIDEFERKINPEIVSRSCLLPNWLNALAERRGINFSAALQRAIQQELGI